MRRENDEGNDADDREADSSLFGRNVAPVAYIESRSMDPTCPLAHGRRSRPTTHGSRLNGSTAHGRRESVCFVCGPPSLTVLAKLKLPEVPVLFF